MKESDKSCKTCKHWDAIKVDCPLGNECKVVEIDGIRQWGKWQAKDPNPTTAQLTAFGAGKMGYDLVHIYCGEDYYVKYDDKGMCFSIHTDDFTPTTDIAQAIDVAGESRVKVSFTKNMDGEWVFTMKWSDQIRKTYHKSLPACALQIMKTLWEVEKNG